MREGVSRSRKWVAVSSKLAVENARGGRRKRNDDVSDRNAVCRGEQAGHGLVYFCVERETLLAVEDIDADVIALLPELFAAGLADGWNDDYLVCGLGGGHGAL